MATRRFVLTVLTLASMALALPVHAQSRPTEAQLRRLIARALNDPETVTFARPQPLGFMEKVVTHQVSLEHDGTTYTLAVTSPRLKDGLIFFSHQPSQQLFIMHRTDTHLLRVSSARNDLTQGNAGLQPWDGPSADNDFNAQLAFWASVQ